MATRGSEGAGEGARNGAGGPARNDPPHSAWAGGGDGSGHDGLDDDLEGWPNEWEPDHGSPRRRHSPAVRVLGLVIAASLVLGTVGTTIGLVLGGSSGPGLRTRVLSVRATTGTAVVTFEVSNPGDDPVEARCVLRVLQGGDVTGVATVQSSSPIPAGEVSTLTAEIHVVRSNPGSAGVRCDAVSPGGPDPGPPG